MEEFQAHYQLLKEIIQATGARGSVAGVKCCMNLLGYQAGFPRGPLLPVEKETEDEIRASLQRYGKLERERYEDKRGDKVCL